MVAIKDLEMPKCCGSCEFCREDNYSRDYCEVTGSGIWSREEIQKDCPLVEFEVVENDDAAAEKRMSQIKALESKGVSLEYGERFYRITYSRREHFSEPCPVCDDTHKIQVRGYVLDCPFCRSARSNTNATHLSLANYEIREYIVDSITISGTSTKKDYQGKIVPPKISGYTAFTRIGRKDGDIERISPWMSIECWDISFDNEKFKKDMCAADFNGIEHHYWRDKKEAEKFLKWIGEVQRKELEQFNKEHNTQYEYPF